MLMGKSVLEEEIPRHIITGRGESETDLEAFDWFKKGNLFFNREIWALSTSCLS